MVRSRQHLFFLTGIIVFVLLLLISPAVFRYLHQGEALLLSSESYYDYRIATYLLEHGSFPSYDTLSYSGRPFVFTSIYPAVLSMLSQYTGISLFWLILGLPVLCGILSFVLLYSILEKSDWSLQHRRIFMMLLATSPLFIYLFSVSNTYYFPVFFLLCFFFFFRSSHLVLRYVSFLFLLVIPLFGYVHAIVSLFVLLFFVLSLRRKSQFFIVLISFLVLFFAYLFLSDLLSFRLSSDISSFSFLITDFGYLSGISLFALFLFVLGILYLVSQRTMFSVHFPVFCLFMLFLLLYFFIGDGILFYLNILVIWYASYGFLWLLQFPYESPMMKSLILIVLFSSAIFVPVSYIHRSTSFYPESSLVDALTYLQSFPYGTVLSSPKHGVLINALSEKPNVADEQYAYAPNPKQRLDDIEDIYYTRDISLVDAYFQQYGISYVFIDPQMRKNIWITDKEGLLFLLERSGRFQNIYAKDGMFIYSYVRS